MKQLVQTCKTWDQQYSDSSPNVESYQVNNIDPNIGDGWRDEDHEENVWREEDEQRGRADDALRRPGLVISPT